MYTDKEFPLSNRGSPQLNKHSPQNTKAYTHKTYEVKSGEKRNHLTE